MNNLLAASAGTTAAAETSAAGTSASVTTGSGTTSAGTTTLIADGSDNLSLSSLIRASNLSRY